jgi:Flp pilus assembly protein TadD
LQRGELDLAARWFTKLVHNDPQNPQFLLKLAMTHEQRQQPAETDRAYRKLLDAHPTFMLGVRRYSTFLEAQGRPLDSRNLWLRLAGLLPGYVGVETRTARAEIAAGLKAEAHDRMRRYTATNPDDHEGWVQLGAALGALGRDAEAIEALQKALAIKPTASDALETIVPIYQRTGRSAEARSYIATLQRTAPGDPALKHALELLGR